MKMPTKLIREWLAEYKALPESELHTYANVIRHNDELIVGLYDLLEEDLSNDCIEPVCHQLFNFYKSGNSELRRFTLELVPKLIWSYMVAVSRNEKKKCGGIESCLSGIYNLEVVDDNGQPKVKTFTIPTLAKPSIYHEPPSLATLALTETSLLRYHSDEPILITIGPLPQVVSINSQNRMPMLAYVMNIYNTDIGSMSPKSRKTMCLMASRLAKTGFDNLGYEETLQLNDSMSSASSRGSGFAGRRSISFIKEPRIPLSPGFLIELLSAVYFTMFNGEVQVGMQALEDMHLRASFELYSDVLLVTNAIQNSLRFNPSGQPQDGPMGISIALSPTQGNPAFSKHAITNASFRTKKLPEDLKEDDDIPFVDETPKPAQPRKIDPPPNYKEAKHSPKPRKGSASEVASPKHKKKAEKEAKRVSAEVKRSSSGKKGKEKEKEKKEGKRETKHKEGGIVFKLGGLVGSPAVKGKKSKQGKISGMSLEDIDVPAESSEQETEAPPQYDDAMSQEGASTSGATPSDKSGLSGKLGKPLRSIMKKTSEKKEKKEHKLDIKKRGDSVDTHSPKSPKHSVSLSAGLGSTTSYNNGDVTDPSQVSVHVVRSSSRTMVDGFEMKEGKKSSTMSAISSGSGGSVAGNGGHKTSASMPEEGYTDEELDGDVTNHRPLLSSHSKDHIRATSNGAEKETNGSLNTQL